MRFITAEFSRQGGRKNNEDSCGSVFVKKKGCWVVADGLGGHRGGEVASKMAVEEILEAFRAHPAVAPEILRRQFEAAHQAVIRRQEKDPGLASMRTTAAVLIADAGGALWGHVGDSRLYHLHNGRIVFQTKDHSVAQVMADAGDISPGEIRFSEDRNRLLRSIGSDDDLRPSIEEVKHPVAYGDTFLLCTDGFWEYVTETEMEVDLAKSSTPEAWIEAMVSRMLERVKKDHDNYTAVALFVEA